MIIIGVDSTRVSQIASVDTDTGEVQEKRLAQSRRGGEVLPSSGRVAVLSCGSEMRPTFAPGECANRRQIARMRNWILRLLLERPLSEDLGAELGEPGSAATALASSRMVQARTRI